MVSGEPQTPAEGCASLTWAQRSKRVFGIDIETCGGSGGAVNVIACVKDPAVIQKILEQLKDKAERKAPTPLPESRRNAASLTDSRGPLFDARGTALQRLHFHRTRRDSIWFRRGK